MIEKSEPSVADIVRATRAFIMVVLTKDAAAFKPNIPRAKGPLTPLAQTIFRNLIFCFENITTGLCMPSISTIADTSACSESQTKVLLGALYQTEYLTWRHGKRKRVLTRKGWRVVHSSNCYQIFCPRRHLAELRRKLLKSFGGKGGPLIQKIIARYTPPTEEAKATAEIVAELATDLRPGMGQVTPTPEPEPPPKPMPEGAIEVGGVKVSDPELGNVLSRLWAALEKREAWNPSG